MEDKKVIRNSNDAYEFLKRTLVEEEYENLLMISLNQAAVVKKVDWLTSGSDTSTVMSTKQICRNAVMNNACAIIMVHNHPSGNLKPSHEDLESTRRIKEALEVFDIQLVDHIIIGGGGTGYYSMADEQKF